MYERDLLYMTIYCDTTGLYTEDEINKDNLTEIAFPRWIVKEWFEQSDEKELYSFEKWLEELYDADSTDGLYQFALDRGFRGIRPDLEER